MQLQALRQQFELVRSELADEAVRAKKLESKVEVLTAGYQARVAKLSTTMLDQHFNFSEAASELECFKGLQANETRALPLRVQVTPISPVLSVYPFTLCSDRWLFAFYSN